MKPQQELKETAIKTTVSLPPAVQDGLQHYIANNRGITLRDQSRIVTTALVLFLRDHNIEIDLKDPMVKRYILPSVKIEPEDDEDDRAEE